VSGAAAHDCALLRMCEAYVDMIMLGTCKGFVWSHSDCSPTVVCVSHHIIPLASGVVQCFAAGPLGGKSSYSQQCSGSWKACHNLLL
jgi:hypothetical protein